MRQQCDRRKTCGVRQRFIPPLVFIWAASQAARFFCILWSGCGLRVIVYRLSSAFVIPLSLALALYPAFKFRFTFASTRVIGYFIGGSRLNSCFAMGVYRSLRRGKSGLHWARCQVTPGRREPTESATENKPPVYASAQMGKGEKVR